MKNTSVFKTAGYLLLAAFLAVATNANAKEINFILAGSEGGGMATLSKTLVPELEKFGHDINLVVGGDCVNAKRLYEKSNNPSVVVWASSFYFTENPCAVDLPTNDTMFSVWNHVPAYVCVAPDFEDVLTRNTEISLGTHYPSGLPSYITDALEEYNPNINVVHYQGSSNIQAGLVSGEIDVVLSDRGMWMQENGHVDCIYNTSQSEKNGTKPLGSEIGMPSLSYEFMVYAYTHNMDVETRDQLLLDFQSVLQTEKFLDHYERESWDNKIQQTSAENQLKFFKANIPQ